MLHDRISFTPAYKQTRRRVLKVVLFANADAFEKAVSIWKQLDGVDKPCGGRGGRKEGGRDEYIIARKTRAQMRIFHVHEETRSIK